MSGPWKRDKPSFEDRQFTERFWMFWVILGYLIILGVFIWNIYCLLTN